MPTSTPTPIPWNLDRIDQRHLPLDNQYTLPPSGRDVYIYLLDSGLRLSHSEFYSAVFGTDLVSRFNHSTDSTGHGTHIAGIITGRNYGVAKASTLVSVRVLDNRNMGYTVRLIEALEWALQNSNSLHRKPAVVTMALTTPYSKALNDAVRRVVEGGIPVVAAAGNDGNDSCKYSPASAESAITVAATDKIDKLAGFSSRGECVDLFAPGVDILSSWHTGDEARKVRSGSSAAAAHVAGAGAVLLGDNPNLKGEDVKKVLTGVATNVEGKELVYVGSVGTVGERPRAGRIFIYGVLGIEKCDGDLGGVKKVVKDSIVGSMDVKVWTCCSSTKEKCQGVLKGVVVRLDVAEVYGGRVFEEWETFMKENIKKMKEEWGSKMWVMQKAWVVDEREYKYWAAPQLERKESTKGTLWIGLGLCGLFALIVLAFFYSRRRRRRERTKERTQLELKMQEFELQKGATNLDAAGEETPVHGIRRINTALQGDVLRNLGAYFTPKRMRSAKMPPLTWRTPRASAGAQVSGGQLPRIVSFGPGQGAVAQSPNVAGADAQFGL